MTNQKPFLTKFARIPVQQHLEIHNTGGEHHQAVSSSLKVEKPRPTIYTSVHVETSDDR